MSITLNGTEMPVTAPDRTRKFARTRTVPGQFGELTAADALARHDIHW